MERDALIGMRSQAENAGRLGTGGDARPQKGTVLRDVELQLADGTHRLLSAIRGHANLVMVLTAGQDVQNLLNRLSSVSRAIEENSARVLLISLGSARRAPITGLEADLLSLCIDPAGTTHRTLGAIDSSQAPVPTVYVTDRFGEIFAGFRGAEAAALLQPEEIVGWLEFIGYQCEECGPPEWPE